MTDLVITELVTTHRGLGDIELGGVSAGSQLFLKRRHIGCLAGNGITDEL